MTKEAKVLVVDDNQAVRVTVTEILRAVGYRVSQAEDGLQACEQLTDSDVDAVVLDINMPGKDGISVLEDLDPAPPPPGVLLISAYDVDPLTLARLGNAVHRFLRKPVPPQTLIDAVADAVAVSRSARGA
jgi:CheY-like chemotaxis protein